MGYDDDDQTINDIKIQNSILVIDNGQAKVYIYIDGWRFYLNWLSDTTITSVQFGSNVWALKMCVNFQSR